MNQEATGDDDDLTELEDTQPSTSAQVSLIYSSESCVTDRQTDSQVSQNDALYSTILDELTADHCGLCLT